MLLNFEKWNACGNDFLLVHRHRREREEWRDFFSRKAKFLCSRKGEGVGADGVLVIFSQEGEEDELLIVNADGTFAKNCGNGLRAASLSLYLKSAEKSSVPLEGASFRVEGKVIDCQFVLEDHTVDAKAQKLPWVIVTMPDALDSTSQNTEVESWLRKKIGSDFEMRMITIGNSHCTIKYLTQLPELEKIILLSKELQTNFSDFNVTWYQEIDPPKKGQRDFDVETAFRAIPYERGSGLTGACGSGACAITHALVLEGFADKHRWSEIQMPGGNLYVSQDQPHRLTGRCQRVFLGQIEI